MILHKPGHALHGRLVHHPRRCEYNARAPDGTFVPIYLVYGTANRERPTLARADELELDPFDPPLPLDPVLDRGAR